MLERRVSNQRSELTNDQQMNYLLAWFNGWSDLQREDFIPVLAEKLSSKMINANGIEEHFNSLTIDNGRPPSLFKCQVSHFILRNPYQILSIFSSFQGRPLHRLGCSLVRWPEELFHHPTQRHRRWVLVKVRAFPRVWQRQPRKGLLWARRSGEPGFFFFDSIQRV